MKRKCWKCKNDFPLTSEFFYKDGRDKNGFQKRCKTCNRIFNQNYKLEHPGYFKHKNSEKYFKKIEENPSFNKERYSNNKEAFLERKKDFKKTKRGRLYSLVYVAEQRAQLKKMEFELTLDYLINLWDKQNGECALTGIPFDLENKDERFIKTKYYPLAPSIDRIDSFKGYTKDNIRLVLTGINLAMNQFGEHFFNEMIIGYQKMALTNNSQINL